jgi:hypothetical protein
MDAQEIRSGHTHATRERSRAQEVVWLVHDTTLLDDGTTQPQPGRGTVKLKVRDASLRQPTVALTPARINLGVVGMTRWQRPEPPVAQARHRTPMAAKARYRWLHGYQLACEVQQRGPDTRVVRMADREGDSHEWCLDAVRRAPEARAEVSLRAKGHRRIGTGKPPSSVWEERQKARAAASITVELPRPPHRAPRQATLRVAVKRVTFTGARRPGGPRPPVEVVAVYATARRPPRNAAPSAWLLLTRLPGADVPSAGMVVHW